MKELDFKKNWKKLSLIGLISFLAGFEYLVMGNHILVFLASFMTSIVVAIISFLLFYYISNEKPKGDRISKALDAAIYVIIITTIISYM